MQTTDTPGYPSHIIDLETFRQQQSAASVAPTLPQGFDTSENPDLVPVMMWMPMWVMVPKDYAQSMPNPFPAN